jgi:hypothetical protein
VYRPVSSIELFMWVENLELKRRVGRHKRNQLELCEVSVAAASEPSKNHYLWYGNSRTQASKEVRAREEHLRG